MRQSIALDRRTGNEDVQIIQLGNMALNNKKYDDAQKAFEYLMGKGKDNQFFHPVICTKNSCIVFAIYCGIIWR